MLALTKFGIQGTGEYFAEHWSPYLFADYSFPFNYIEELRGVVDNHACISSNEVRNGMSDKYAGYVVSVYTANLFHPLCSRVPDCNTSFLVWATLAGQKSYVLRNLSGDNYSLCRGGAGVLLPYALAPILHPDLVQYFFSKGVSPNLPITIDASLGHLSVSVWFVFLRTFASEWLWKWRHHRD